MVRVLSCIIAFLFSCRASFAGSVQLLDGTTHEGELTLADGVLVRGSRSVKVALSNVLVARFKDEPAAGKYVPGVVLTNGTRIAGEFSSLTEPTVRFERKGIQVPSGDIAWAIYQPFEAALAAAIPKAKTGALLAGGDFFEGTCKAADARMAKVLNPIFGPHIFSAASGELHALVLREVKSQAATFEVITSDGSCYLAMEVLVRDATSVVLRHPHYDGLKIDLDDLVEIRAAPARLSSFGLQKPARPNERAGESGG